MPIHGQCYLFTSIYSPGSFLHFPPPQKKQPISAKSHQYIMNYIYTRLSTWLPPYLRRWLVTCAGYVNKNISSQETITYWFVQEPSVIDTRKGQNKTFFFAHDKAMAVDRVSRPYPENLLENCVVEREPRHVEYANMW